MRQFHICTISSGLAAIAGQLLCQTYPTLTPCRSHAWYQSFRNCCIRWNQFDSGAMVGGILLESSRSSEKPYISSQVADAIVFAVLIVVLLIKPTGLFGKNIQRKRKVADMKNMKNKTTKIT